MSESIQAIIKIKNPDTGEFEELSIKGSTDDLTDSSGKNLTSILDDIRGMIIEHTANEDNPHTVTKRDVGLDKVENLPLATEEEAKKGTSNSSYMTPLRSNDLINSNLDEVRYKEIIMPNPSDLPEVYPEGLSIARSINVSRANTWTNFIDDELGTTSATGGRVQIITFRSSDKWVATQRVIHYSFNDKHIIGIYERTGHQTEQQWGNFIPIYQEDFEQRRIDTKPADFDDYHFGQTFMDIRGNGKSLGYPQEHCLVITLRSHRRQMTQWCFPNGYAESQIGAYIRQWHENGPNNGWNPWMKLVTDKDIDDKFYAGSTTLSGTGNTVVKHPIDGNYSVSITPITSGNGNIGEITISEYSSGQFTINDTGRTKSQIMYTIVRH